MQCKSRAASNTRPEAGVRPLNGSPFLLAERIRRFDVFTRIAAFFSQMAAVTFGGGDAMLA